MQSRERKKGIRTEERATEVKTERGAQREEGGGGQVEVGEGKGEC